MPRGTAKYPLGQPSTLVKRTAYDRARRSIDKPVHVVEPECADIFQVRRGAADGVGNRLMSLWIKQAKRTGAFDKARAGM